jgi:hypothetical protein
MKTGIHKQIIIDLINALADKDDFLSKKELILNIYKLNETSIIKKKQTKTQPQNRINGCFDIIGYINNYQNESKLVGSKTSYKKYISKQLERVNIYNLDYKAINIKLHAELFKLDIGCKEISIEEHEFIKSLNELMEILHVSKPTINHWEEMGIITKHRIRPTIIINNTTYSCNWTYYYNLDSIKLNIKAMSQIKNK